MLRRPEQFLKCLPTCEIEKNVFYFKQCLTLKPQVFHVVEVNISWTTLKPKVSKLETAFKESFQSPVKNCKSSNYDVEMMKTSCIHFLPFSCWTVNQF